MACACSAAERSPSRPRSSRSYLGSHASVPSQRCALSLENTSASTTATIWAPLIHREGRQYSCRAHCAGGWEEAITHGEPMPGTGRNARDVGVKAVRTGRRAVRLDLRGERNETARAHCSRTRAKSGDQCVAIHRASSLRLARLLVGADTIGALSRRRRRGGRPKCAASVMKGPMVQNVRDRSLMRRIVAVVSWCHRSPKRACAAFRWVDVCAGGGTQLQTRNTGTTEDDRSGLRRGTVRSVSVGNGGPERKRNYPEKGEPWV